MSISSCCRCYLESLSDIREPLEQKSRIMDRFNPFASDSQDSPDPFTISFNRSSQAKPQQETGGRVRTTTSSPPAAIQSQKLTTTGTSNTPRYSTTFPDPLDADEQPATLASSNKIANRSNSVTFAPSSQASGETASLFATPTRGGQRQTGTTGFTSFLTRATSVTSSSVTDRMSGAVDSVRNAVDSISSQIQAVPANLNERLSSTASNLIGSGEQLQQQQQQQQQQPNQQQQSTASYLVSKLSSATGQFSAAGQSPSLLPVISRQRVILILDNHPGTDWAQQFNNYRKMTTSLGSATQSALTSFFSTATTQLTSSSNSSPISLDSADLVEQVDFRDISVLANQATSTATVYFTCDSQTSNLKTQTKATGKTSRSKFQIDVSLTEWCLGTICAFGWLDQCGSFAFKFCH